MRWCVTGQPGGLRLGRCFHERTFLLSLPPWQLFDQDVAVVPVDTDARVRALLDFTPPLPPPLALTGTWLDSSTLLVTINGVATPTQASAVGMTLGTLTVRLQEAGGLRSAVGQSASSTATGVLSQGSWYVVWCGIGWASPPPPTPHLPTSRSNTPHPRKHLTSSSVRARWLVAGSAGATHRVCTWPPSPVPPSGSR